MLQQGTTVIFLDIDGVLCNARSMMKDYDEGDPSLIHDPLGNQRPLERRCVDQLHRVAHECGAVIVLSTAWRLHAPKREFLINALAPLCIVGCTPDLKSFGRDRGAEVNAYLAEHPNVKQFVILDDDYAADFFAEGLGDCLVECELHKDDPLQEGLTESLADEAISVLSQVGSQHVQTDWSARLHNLLPAAAELPTHTGRAHVFILAGQSNMAGRAPVDSLAVDCNELGKSVRLCWCNDINFATPDEQQLCMRGWGSLQPQLSIARGEHYGPEMGLAAPLLEHFQGESIYLIKYAMGSTSLSSHWNPLAPGDPNGPDGTYFKHFISFCFKSLAALQHLEPQLEGKAKTANAYYDHLLSLVTSVRKNLGEPELPFIASEIVWKSKQTKKVNNAIRALQDGLELENCYCSSAPDMGVLEDGHLSAESVVQVGDRMASTFIMIRA